MVRKSQKVAFENIDADVAAQIILATTGKLKDKDVDPRKQIGTIHIKKYLAIESINNEYENWIALLKKTLQAKKDNSPVDYSAEETALLEECKRRTAEYLEEEGSEALKNKVKEQQDELEQLKNIASSMKYKFSTFSFEAITHVLNLMVRELLVFTCDNCLSNGAKLTKGSHVPWTSLQPKLLSGLYMNTPLVYGSIHKSTEEPPVVENKNDEDVEVDGEDTEKVVVRPIRPKLTQYITNTFKEITSREPRFNGLLLGKDLTALINDLVYQVIDRYVNVIKSLLMVANSKTITDHLALIATKIILQDDIHTSDDDVRVIIDVVQARVDEIRATKSNKKDSVEEESFEEEEEPVEEEPVQVESPKKGKSSKKA
jgi:hypothetical protein